MVRLGSVAEAVLGMVALSIPSAGSAWLVALSYAGFAIVVAYARSKGGAIASCGCFGTPDSPATMVHVVVDAGLAVSAAVVAIASPSGSILSILSRQPGHGVPLIVVSALCAWLTYLVLSVLTRLQSVRRPVALAFGSTGLTTGP